MFPSFTVSRAYTVFSQHGDETIPLYVKSAALATARSVAAVYGWAWVEADDGEVVWDSNLNL